ncbi:shikimate dehydrogenase [Actinomycetaceae bacterium TAE3-ERU4]|nr:shikimate dehydrogenase [Actinomycetaceae bacterium TAE3-ERU4]
MRHFALIGSPITHSFSPAIHQAGYRALGLEADYSLFECSQIPARDFPGFNFSGLSVTMPLKQQVIPFLDSVEPLADAVGSVNTVINSDGFLTGFNTDVYGISQAIRACCTNRDFSKVVILGSRASACSALAAVNEFGNPEVSVVARTLGGPGTVSIAAGKMGVIFHPIPWRMKEKVYETIREADLLISTVPNEALVDFPDLSFSSGTVVLEAAYKDKNSFLKNISSCQKVTYIPGTEMLFYQALQQFSLMTGKPAPADAMRKELEAQISLSMLR